LAIGWSLLHLRAWSKDTEVEMILALLTPFAAFWPPHFLGGSGVLAAVTAGLYTSCKGPGLIPPATRLQGFFVWGLAVYLIEGVVFFLTGLQSRLVMEGPDAGEWSRMIGAASITVVLVVVIRFVWVFAAAYLPTLLSRNNGAQPRGVDPRRVTPTWQETFLVGFTGIRGVVSLAAALSIPEMVGVQEFPDRDLILFVTFCVILFSLVGQGAALPKVIRYLGLDKAGATEAESAKRNEVTARVAGIRAALDRLKELTGEGTVARSAANLRRLHEGRLTDFVHTSEGIDAAPVAEAAGIQLQLVAAERASIASQYAAEKLTDEARRRIERELDLEDARIRHAADSAAGNGFQEI
jgi:CPA1 family monovalent cation:H+ antiporter